MDLGPPIDAAIDFLLSARDSRGWWRDFDTLAGTSTEWVTAYVGAALAAAPHPFAYRTARESWSLLNRSRWWSPGWGYNSWVPPDADSTTWAMLLAEGVDAGHSVRVRRARRFLDRHVRSSCGSVTTFAADGPIRRFTRLRRQISFRGWCGAHTCVAAAVANLKDLHDSSRIRAYLRRAQREDGSWTGYWWCDHEYTTALAAEALSVVAEPEDFGRVQLAVEWASRRIDQNGSVTCADPSIVPAFATSWCLRTLVLGYDREEVRMPIDRAVRWLLQHQKPDGSWARSTRLRIPPPDVVDPEGYASWIVNGRGGGSIVFDQQAVFTTASVIKALQAVRTSVVRDEHDTAR